MTDHNQQPLISSALQKRNGDLKAEYEVGTPNRVPVVEVKDDQIEPNPDQVTRSVLDWPEFLQREGCSLYLLTLSLSPGPTNPTVAIRRELQRIFWVLDRKFAVGGRFFDNERPTLVLLPARAQDVCSGRVECRALVGIPLLGRTVAAIAGVSASSASREGLTVSMKPIHGDELEQLASVIADLASLPEKDWFILPEERVRNCESSGLPMISDLQLDSQYPNLLEIQRNFSRLVDRYGAALSHGQSLQVVTRGMYPATVLIVVPITDLIDYTLDSRSAKRAGDRLELRWRGSSRAMLRRATIVIPGVGSQNTCFGDPEFVLEDVKRSFMQFSGHVSQTSIGAEALARQLAPLSNPCCWVVCNRPFSIAYLLSVSIE